MQGQASSSTEAAAVPAGVKTRLLKDVEAEEKAFLYQSLYRSLDDAADARVRDDFSSTSDILADARRAKAEFLRAAAQPLADKARGCGPLLARLAEAPNKKVASVFLTVTVAMITLPVIATVVGMQVVAPKLGWDAAGCGGFTGLGTAVLIMVGYVVYAFHEDRGRAGARAAGPTAERSDVPKGAAHKKKD